MERYVQLSITVAIASSGGLPVSLSRLCRQSGRISITSVDLIRAAAICPFSRRISRAASEVMTDVRC
jgi:hypothetical protein